MTDRVGCSRTRRVPLVVLALVACGSLVTGVIRPQGAHAAPLTVQEAPRGACLPGGTPGARIDGIIAVLIGVAAPPPAPDAAPGARGRCLGVVALGYLDPLGFGSWLGMDKDQIWSRYQGGASLTRIANDAGRDRDAVIAQLQSMYGTALDEAVGAGAIDSDQRTRLANRILPQFAWLVDWDRRNGVNVAAGDVNNDGSVDLFEPRPGENGNRLVDDVIDVVLNVDAADYVLWTRVFESGASHDAWPTLGPEVFGDVAELIGGDGSSTPGELLALYRSGQSLREIAEANGVDGDALAAKLHARAESALDAAVDAGTIPAADRDRAAAEIAYLIVVVLDHHTGDPLPNDFTNTTFDDEVAS